MKNIKGFYLILLCILANFFSQIFFNILSKTQLSELTFSFLSLKKNLLIIFSSKFFFIAILLYTFSAIFWLLGIKKMPLSKAFSYTSINYILITIYSVFILNEEITINKILSILFITLGVIIMNSKEFNYSKK